LVAVWLAALAFLALVVPVALAPERFGIKQGVPLQAWRVAAFVATIGLVAAVGWFRPGSLGRVAGALGLLGAAILLVSSAPLDMFNEPQPLWKRAVIVSPALVGACWYALVFAVLRRHAGAPTRSPSPVNAVLFAALAGLFFVSLTLWQPRVGLLRVVLALDLKSGELLWQRPVFLAPAERKYHCNSYATPTPCTDGKYIFAHFGSGYACLDMDGRLLWHDVDEDYTNNTRYGAASSPVMTEDSVIVVQESECRRSGDQWFQSRPSYIVALDKLSGRPRWRVQPADARDSYASPLLWRRGSSLQLLTASWDLVVAYDVASGERLWSQAIPIRQIVPSMVRERDLLVVAGGTHGPKGVFGLKVGGEGKGTSAEILWRSQRNVPGCPSPVLCNGMLFVIDDNGMLTCYEPTSGEVLWKKRLSPAKYLSSLVAGDGKVYACNEAGVTNVVAADSTFHLLASNHLDGPCYASPALADGCILIRTGGFLYCIEGEKGTAGDGRR
jgi:outer membrane protein assembly factor BamB